MVTHQPNNIKLIVFDLDGVLVDSRPLHYDALNMALQKTVGDDRYTISHSEHAARYDGLPTAKKLNMLTELKGLPVEMHTRVWEAKQQMTLFAIDRMTHDDRMRGILEELKKQGYLIYCASNAIWVTVTRMLLRRGLLEYFDYIVSFEDCRRPKPSPNIYLRCFERSGCSPRETIILEDSPIGRKAAESSCAHLCPIKDPDDVTLAKIEKYIHLANRKVASMEMSKPWEGKLYVIVPAAGDGSRFRGTQYEGTPKPLIDVRGHTMLGMVVRNLKINAHYVFIVRRKHYNEFNMKYVLQSLAPGCDIVIQEEQLKGAAHSVSLARHLIPEDAPVITVNSDQFIEGFSTEEFLHTMSSPEVDGGILCFKDNHPKWSYARLDEAQQWVVEVAEKRVVSDNATVGLYYWKRSGDLFRSIDQMIDADEKINNEFYLAPCFNQMIKRGCRVKIYTLDQTKGQRMHGTGTGDDLEKFLQSYHGPI